MAATVQAQAGRVESPQHQARSSQSTEAPPVSRMVHRIGVQALVPVAPHAQAWHRQPQRRLLALPGGQPTMCAVRSGWGQRLATGRREGLHGG